MIALAIFLVILANLLVSNLTWRYDASYGKAYTLAPSSKKILHDLKDNINITFFVSNDLPTRLAPLKTDVVSLLEEYKRENNHVKVSYVDPKSNSTAATNAKSFNIPELQFSQLEQDKYAVTTAYFGIGIAKGSSKESIPQVTDIGSLEYNTTSAIYKLTRSTIPRVGVVGQGPLYDQDPYSALKGILSKQFELQSLSTATDSALLSKSKALLILDDNVKTYSRDEVNALEKYIKSGGNAVMFADGLWVNPQVSFEQAVTTAQHALFGLARAFGIDIGKDLVLSTSSEIVSFGGQGGTYLAQYPLWVRTPRFNNKSSYFTGVTQLTYPWVASLQAKSTANVEVIPLVETSSQSWTQSGNVTIDPQGITAPKANQLKSYLVTAEAKYKNGGKLLVIPSSRFVQDAFLSQGSDNIGFMLNVLNDYASSGALTGIRTRTVNLYPLPDLNNTQKDMFKYFNILLLPVLFGLYGIWRLLKRR